jgi:hypothetical protein
MGTNSDKEFIQELQEVSFQPVFILGLHRSGTSILYKMLVKTGNFNPVTAYHLINYNELLSNHHLKKEKHAQHRLTELFTEKGLQDRGIDRLKVTADFAEEYGFLLNTQTLKMSLTRKNIALFTQMCKKIQFIAGNDRPVLLKNPYDFPNFVYIKQVFPNARFVFIHRHPLKTISSTLNAVKMILKNKNPYTTLLSKIYDTFYSNPLFLHPLRFIFCTIPECGVILITRITAKATDYYLKNIEKLPKEDYISITYEEFCMHPQETIENIMKRFSLDMRNKIDASSLMKPRSVDVDVSVKKFQKHIYHSMKTYCDTFQYAIREE